MNDHTMLTNDVSSSSDRPFNLPFTDKDTALICEPDGLTRDTIVATLTQMGYQITVSTSPGESIRGMKYHTYNLLMLNEDFVAPGSVDNEILAYLGLLPMSIRRRMFVALICSRHMTNDRLAAFYKSVNLIINSEKMDDLDGILRSCIEENSLRYHVFREVSIKIGRI